MLLSTRLATLSMEKELREWERICEELLSPQAPLRDAAEKQLSQYEHQPLDQLQGLLIAALVSSTHEMAIFKAIGIFRASWLARESSDHVMSWLFPLIPQMVQRWETGHFSDMLVKEFCQTLAITIKKSWLDHSSSEHHQWMEGVCGRFIQGQDDTMGTSPASLYFQMTTALALVIEFSGNEKKSSAYGMGLEKHYQCVLSFYQEGYVTRLWQAGWNLWHRMGQGYQASEKMIKTLFHVLGSLLRWNFAACVTTEDGLVQFRMAWEDPDLWGTRPWQSPREWMPEVWEQGGIYHLLVPTLQSPLSSVLAFACWDVMERMCLFVPSSTTRNQYRQVLMEAWCQLLDRTQEAYAHLLISCVRQGWKALGGVEELSSSLFVSFVESLARFTQRLFQENDTSQETIRDLVTLWASLVATPGIVEKSMASGLYTVFAQRCQRHVQQDLEWFLDQERFTEQQELCEEELENMSFVGRMAMDTTLSLWTQTLEPLNASCSLSSTQLISICEAMWWMGGLLADRSEGEEPMIPDAITTHPSSAQIIPQIFRVLGHLIQSYVQQPSVAVEESSQVLRGVLLWFFARCAPTYLSASTGGLHDDVSLPMVDLLLVFIHQCVNSPWHEPRVPLRDLATRLLWSLTQIPGMSEKINMRPSFNSLNQYFEQTIASSPLLMTWEGDELSCWARGMLKLHSLSGGKELLLTVQRRLVVLIAHVQEGHAPELAHYVQIVAGFVDSLSPVSLQMVEMFDALVVSLRQSGSLLSATSVLSIFRGFFEVHYDFLPDPTCLERPCRKLLESVHALLKHTLEHGHYDEESVIDCMVELVSFLWRMGEQYRMMEDSFQQVLVQSIELFVPLVFPSDKQPPWLLYPALARPCGAWIRAIAIQPTLCMRCSAGIFHKILLHGIPQCGDLGHGEVTQQVLEGLQHLIHYGFLVPDHPDLEKYWTSHESLDSRLIHYLLTQVPMQGTLPPAASTYAGDALLFLILRAPHAFQSVASHLIQSLPTLEGQQRLGHLFTSLTSPPFQRTLPDALLSPHRTLFRQRYQSYQQQVFLLLQQK